MWKASAEEDANCSFISLSYLESFSYFCAEYFCPMKQEVVQAIEKTLKQVLPQGAQAFVYIHFTPFFHNVKDEGVRLV